MVVSIALLDFELLKSKRSIDEKCCEFKRASHMFAALFISPKIVFSPKLWFLLTAQFFLLEVMVYFIVLQLSFKRKLKTNEVVTFAHIYWGFVCEYMSKKLWHSGAKIFFVVAYNHFSWHSSEKNYFKADVNI